MSISNIYFKLFKLYVGFDKRFKSATLRVFGYCTHLRPQTTHIEMYEVCNSPAV